MPPSSSFRSPDPDEPSYEMEVFIDEMGESSGVGGGVANFLSGYVVYRGERFHFEAVAYGRIGGQNVSPNLTEQAMKRLQELEVDLDSFNAQLQRKLVEGEITVVIPEGTPPPSLDP